MCFANKNVLIIVKAMKRKIRRSKNYSVIKTILGTATITALVCFGVFCVIRYREEQQKISTESETETQTQVQNVTDRKDSDRQITETTTTENEESSTEIEEDPKVAAEAAATPKEVAKNDDGLKIAEPQFSSYENDDHSVDFYGEVPNILDEEATCTFVFEKDGERVEKSVGLMPDFHMSRCEKLTLAQSELSVGEWTVQLKYKSTYAEGESGKEKVKIN